MFNLLCQLTKVPEVVGHSSFLGEWFIIYSSRYVVFVSMRKKFKMGLASVLVHLGSGVTKHPTLHIVTVVAHCFSENTKSIFWNWLHATQSMRMFG